MRKTVIGPEVGDGLDLFDGVDGVDSLPHSEAVAVELPSHTRVYIAGTGAIESGKVVAPSDPGAQMRHILETIGDILAAVDGAMEDLVRLDLYAEPMSETAYLDVCRARTELLAEGHEPASTMVETEDIGLEEMVIEADADAIIPNGSWESTAISRLSDY